MEFSDSVVEIPLVSAKSRTVKIEPEKDIGIEMWTIDSGLKSHPQAAATNSFHHIPSHRRPR